MSVISFQSKHSILMATVHVLPEVNLPSHPEGALWSCYHKFGCQATTSGMLEKPYQATSGKNRLGRVKHKKVGFFFLFSWSNSPNCLIFLLDSNYLCKDLLFPHSYKLPKKTFCFPVAAQFTIIKVACRMPSKPTSINVNINTCKQIWQIMIRTESSQ